MIHYDFDAMNNNDQKNNNQLIRFIEYKYLIKRGKTNLSEFQDYEEYKLSLNGDEDFSKEFLLFYKNLDKNEEDYVEIFIYLMKKRGIYRYVTDAQLYIVINGKEIRPMIQISIKHANIILQYGNGIEHDEFHYKGNRNFYLVLL